MPADLVDRRTHHTRNALASVTIVTAVLLSLWPLLRCEFTSRDDPLTVSENSLLKPPSVRGVLRYWTGSAWELYTPMTYTVWSAVALLTPQPVRPGQAYALSPLPFHATNLVFHVLTALIIWLILVRLFRNDWAACIGALLFALHPVQVDPVAWVSGLKDVLAGFFAAFAIWQYVIWADRSRDSSACRTNYALCIIATGLATLCKASATMVPGIMLMIDWFLLRRSGRQIARGLFPIALVCLPAIIIARIVQHPQSTIEIWQRPIVSLCTLTFYLAKIAWPAQLAPDYGLTPELVLQSKWIWACWIIPIALATLLFMLRRRRPELLAGALIFVVGILPVLGLVPFGYQEESTVADHYLYLAMFGLALAAAGTLARTASRSTWIIATAIVVALGFRSYQQTWHWRDTITLFTHNARVTPYNWRPENAIGADLLRQKQFRAAEPHFRASIAIHPTHHAYTNLAAVRIAQGDTRESLYCLEQAALLRPDWALMHLQLAEAYLRYDRPADAEASARRALTLLPNDERSQRVLADAMKRQGKS